MRLIEVVRGHVENSPQAAGPAGLQGAWTASLRWLGGHHPPVADPSAGTPGMLRQAERAWRQATEHIRGRWRRRGARVPLRTAGREAPAPAPAATDSLGLVIADLEELNRTTEHDFLRIGGQLAAFIEAVHQISAELTALGTGSEAHGVRAAQALTGTLARSTEMRAGAEEGNRLLGRMCQEAGRLKQTLSGFQETVATIRTLGVLIRIETARLGSTGAEFGNVADDVKILVGDVQARVQTALATAALLLPASDRALHHLSTLEAGQAKDLPAVITGVLANLASFRDVQASAHEASTRLQAQYGAISAAFNNLIVSLQFHDITRQQVDHVIEALRRLGAPSAGDTRDRATAAILALQSLQLADAGKTFAASVASVEANLDDIARRVRGMAEESRALSGLSADEATSFFLQLERGCTAILASLRLCATAEAATRSASGGLEETLGRMRGAIDEIRAIETQMHRMALNARIRACHIGAAGDALSVLAASMQHGALESRHRSDSLVAALEVMQEAATHLSGRGGPVPAGEGDSPDGSVEGLQIAIAELHTASERSFAQIAQIRARGAQLREDLVATRASFSVGGRFAEAVGRARETLRELGGPDAARGPDGGTEAWESGLADCATQYTMQAERAVHDRVIKAESEGAPAAELGVPSASLPTESEGLGENVELF
jgi:hypothetical protein